MTRSTTPIPQEGGSYVLKGSKLEQREKTLGPLDPEHEANKPRAAVAAPTDKER